jgi:hypothetical protein
MRGRRLVALSPGARQRVRIRVRANGGTMAQIGLRQAARLSGKNTSTIHRAMKTGRLSFTVDEAGARQIDTAELDRVFGIKTLSESNKVNGALVAQPLQSHPAHPGEIAALERLLADREATIADLRHRLDSVMALLTGPRRPWWRRWFR